MLGKRLADAVLAGRLFLACLAISVAPYLAQAQRCVKGTPCGGSCIAAGKTCRVGAPPAKAAPPKDTSASAAAAPPAATGSSAAAVLRTALDRQTGKPVRLINSSLDPAHVSLPLRIFLVTADELVLTDADQRIFHIPLASVEMIVEEPRESPSFAVVLIKKG